MGISTATIRNTGSQVHVDVIDNGQEKRSFIIYDGATDEHEGAAIEYVVNSLGVAFRHVSLVDETVDLTLPAPGWRPDPVYQAGYAHAAGYSD